MLEVPNTKYSPPPGWAAIGAYHSCGYNWATLFYNADKRSIVASDVGGGDYDPSISEHCQPAISRPLTTSTFTSTLSQLTTPLLTVRAVGCTVPTACQTKR